MKKKVKYKTTKLTLPGNVLKFYKELARKSGVTLSQAILVVVMLKIMTGPKPTRGIK